MEYQELADTSTHSEVMTSGQLQEQHNVVALIFEQQHFTYRELNQRANQLAHYLRQLGVGLEMLVGICMERSLEMVVGLLGILKAGGRTTGRPTYPTASHREAPCT